MAQNVTCLGIYRPHDEAGTRLIPLCLTEQRLWARYFIVDCVLLSLHIPLRVVVLWSLELQVSPKQRSLSKGSSQRLTRGGTLFSEW